MEHKIDLRNQEKLRTLPMVTLMYSRTLMMRVSFGRAYWKQEGLVASNFQKGTVLYRSGLDARNRGTRKGRSQEEKL